MKNALMLVGLLAVVSCSSSGNSGTPPVISNFTMTSPVASGSTSLSGSLDIADPEGLAGLSLSITLSGDGATSTLTDPVPGGTTSETAATIPLTITLSASPPAGTYKVTVTASEGNETSNSLSANVTIQ